MKVASTVRRGVVGKGPLNREWHLAGHLPYGIDPFAYLREALPGLFALGEEPTAEQLAAWLPDRRQLDRAKQSSAAPAATG